MPPKRKLVPPANNAKITKFMPRKDDAGTSIDDALDGGHSINDASDTDSTPTAVADSKVAVPKAPVHYCDDWPNKYGTWLTYDSEKNLMYCTLCKERNYHNNLATGTDNFRTTTLIRHVNSPDHRAALVAPVASRSLDTAIANVESKEERGILSCLKTVYWLAKECIPLNKFPSLMEHQKAVGAPDLDCLKVGDRINYSSYTSACGMLGAISTFIDNDITEKLKASPVLTIMTDESTDISVHHKLCISARIVDPVTLAPSTHFLADLRITSATGLEIFRAIETHLLERGISIDTVTGLGTDGASVMTGRKKGLTGQFLRHNPHLVNTHCSAHRLALCSEQAAESIPAMKYYQQILESLFYFFKKSPGRCDSMESMQRVLNDPVLRYREVHQVRWLSFYQALDAVYRTIDSLLSFFTSCSDVKAKGFQKKLSDYFFLYMTYALMDILQPVMKLCLFFQRKDVDIGCVQVCVDQCLGDLQTMLEDDQSPYLKQLPLDLQDGMYKGQHRIQTAAKYPPDKTREKFLSALIDNIRSRFPDKQLMTSFCVLGLRPITFLSEEDLNSWGNESIEVLIEHFGHSKSHSYVSDDGDKVTKTSEPIITGNETREEWQQLKKTVKIQMYPRTSTAALWELLMTYHSDTFPNLCKLASMALSHPVHTSDCERAFSAQNKISTPLRNRLSADHCDQLMRVVVEAPNSSDFDFKGALKVWRGQKSRLVLKKNK